MFLGKLKSLNLQTVGYYFGLILLIFLVSFLNTLFDFSWLIIPVTLAAVLVIVFIYKKPERGILLTAFFLPFERIGALEFSSTTIRLSQLLLIITIAAWLVKSLINKKFALVKNPFLIFLGLFLFVNLISIVNSPNIPRSLIVFAYTIFTCTLAFIIPQLVQSKELIRKVLVVIIVSAVLVSLFGAWQFFGDLIDLPTTVTGLRPLYTKDVLGFPRIQSTAYEPLYFANYLLLPLMALFIFWLTDTKLIKKFWLAPLILLLTFNFIFTVARGAFLALLGVAVLIVIFYLRKILQPKKFIVLLTLLVLILLGTLAILNYTGLVYKTNLQIFSGHLGDVISDTSFSERYYTIEQSFQAWAEHPLIGIGVGAFGPWLASHPFVKPVDGWAIVNNQTLETLAENGILGLIILIPLIGFLILRQIKAIGLAQDKFIKTILYILSITIISIIIQYQTFSTLYIMHIWFIIGLTIACQNLILNKSTT